MAGTSNEFVEDTGNSKTGDVQHQFYPPSPVPQDSSPTDDWEFELIERQPFHVEIRNPPAHVRFRLYTRFLKRRKRVYEANKELQGPVNDGAE